MTDLATRPPSSPRSRKKIIWAVVAVVLIIGAAAGLALFQPWKLFTRSTVNEAVPVAASTDAVGSAAATPPAGAAPSAPDPMTPEALTTDLPAPAAASPAAAPVAGEPTVLASGTFVDGEHATSGTAVLLQLPDGSRFVRLEGFSTSDGPDVDVWLTDQQAGGDDWGKYDDGRYVSLGDLKGTDGNQNYPVPADVDLSGLTSVVIWCDRFNVAFGSAAVSL